MDTHIGPLRVEIVEPMRVNRVISFEAAGPSSIPKDVILGQIRTLKDAIAEALRRGLADGSVVALDDPASHAVRIVDMGLAMAYRWVLVGVNETLSSPLSSRP